MYYTIAPHHLIHILLNKDDYFDSYFKYYKIYHLLISILMLPDDDDDSRYKIYDECWVCYIKTKNKTICSHSICFDCKKSF